MNPTKNLDETKRVKIDKSVGSDYYVGWHLGYECGVESSYYIDAVIKEIDNRTQTIKWLWSKQPDDTKLLMVLDQLHRMKEVIQSKQITLSIKSKESK
jgi:hypothetical protein